MAMKRARIDSVSEQVRVMSAAVRAVEPPSNVPLDPGDMPFFASVLAEFARADWTAHQLELAAMLARKMADLEREQRTFREEGAVAVSPKGALVPNPRLAAIRMLDTSILATRRSLALHARAREGEARDVAKRRDDARQIEAGAPTDDELIAKPH
jgi:hypothetical protein